MGGERVVHSKHHTSSGLHRHQTLWTPSGPQGASAQFEEREQLASHGLKGPQASSTQSHESSSPSSVFHTAFAVGAPLWMFLPMSPPLPPSSSLGVCTVGVGITKDSLLRSKVALPPRLPPIPPLAMVTGPMVPLGLVGLGLLLLLDGLLSKKSYEEGHKDNTLVLEGQAGSRTPWEQS